MVLPPPALVHGLRIVIHHVHCMTYSKVLVQNHDLVECYAQWSYVLVKADVVAWFALHEGAIQAA